MELILDNPFRILGLPITAGEKETAKRISDLVTYAEMGKHKSYDTDFPFIFTYEDQDVKDSEDCGIIGSMKPLENKALRRIYRRDLTLSEAVA